MSFYSLKHALSPSKIDAAVDKVEGIPTAAATTTAVAQITQLVAALPTSNPGANILWNDAGVIKIGTT
jgi:hypothetical protein